jgi:hypothetical protein
MDSVLGMRDGTDAVVDLNDAECLDSDCRSIRRDFGRADVVLNQFSLAGYSGELDRERILPRRSAKIIENMIDNHRVIGAAATVPFASFVYFCCVDNAYMNRFANTVLDVRRAFDAAGLRLAALFPGDVLAVAGAGGHDDTRALSRFAELYRSREALPIDEPLRVPEQDIIRAFESLCRDIHDRYPGTLLRLLLAPVTVHVPDLSVTLRLDLARRRLERMEPGDTADLEVRSQPFFFALSNPYGVQTLGVSARLSVRRGARNWLRHRILFAMNNAEVYLRPRYLFRASNLRFVRERSWSLISQLAYKLRRHRVQQ